MRVPGNGPDEPTRVDPAPYRPGRPVGSHAADGNTVTSRYEPTAVMTGAASPRPAGDDGAGRFAEPRIHPRDLGRRGVITPFARLARGQAFSVMGEALFAIGLANTVFFSTDPNQSRWRVAGYLVLTFAPFLVAGPFIGPVLDRAAGGRKWVIFAAAIARAILCILLLRNLNDIYFYPEAFLMLVFSKINLISKSALVPTTVSNDEELVEANSKLTSLGALSAVVGAALAGIAVLIVKIPFLQLDDGNAKTIAILFLGAIAFVLTASQAWNLPKVQVADHAADETEKAELRSANIFLAASATGFSRATMGFLTFLLAFWVKNENHPIIWIGVLVGGAQVGYFLGSVLAPRIRRAVSEERMIQWSLGATAVAAFITFFLRDLGSGLGGAAILAFTIGLTSNVLKQGFDSLVQRDAPDANRGRSFAKFETRFQLWWAVGALVPVVLPIPLWLGILLIAIVSAFALGSYMFGLFEMTEVVAGRRQPKEKKPKPWSREGIRARRRAEASDEVGGDGPDVPTMVGGPAVQGAGETWAGSPPGVPVGPALVGATDPTVVEPPTEGLFGQPDVPIPDTLYEVPEGGLFDPAAPAPPKPPGYHLPGGEPVWANDATGTETWATVPAADPTPAPGPDPDSGELEIIRRPDGSYGYRGATPSEPVGGPGAVTEVPLPFDDPPPPVVDEQWEYPEPQWRAPDVEPDATAERTTNEWPVVAPPPD